MVCCVNVYICLIGLHFHILLLYDGTNSSEVVFDVKCLRTTGLLYPYVHLVLFIKSRSSFC